MTIGTTPAGYPFPNGDDPVRNGDNVIRALAEAVGLHQAQSFTGPPIAASTPAAGGTVTYVANVRVDAVTWPRLVLVLGKGTTTVGGVDFVTRRGSTEYGRARVPVGTTGFTAAVDVQAAGAAADYNMAMIAAGASTGLADARFGGLIVVTLPLSVAP